MGEQLIDYDVVTEMAGHQKNTGVSLVDATKDIFARVKQQAQQVAVNGTFKSFESMEELRYILLNAMEAKHSVRVHDEDYAG